MRLAKYGLSSEITKHKPVSLDSAAGEYTGLYSLDLSRPEYKSRGISPDLSVRSCKGSGNNHLAS